MKKTMLFFALTIFFCNAFASSAFEKAMGDALNTLNKAKTITELQESANTFERISNQETKEWLPSYYIAYTYMIMIEIEEDKQKKDLYVESALNFIDKSLAISPNNSETLALQGFLYGVKINIDPASRGAELSPTAMQQIGKALAINPDNPRALLIDGIMKYGIAQFMGGDTTQSCASIQNALEKFDTFKPESSLSPVWGKKLAAGYKNICKL